MAWGRSQVWKKRGSLGITLPLACLVSSSPPSCCLGCSTISKCRIEHMMIHESLSDYPINHCIELCNKYMYLMNGPRKTLQGITIPRTVERPEKPHCEHRQLRKDAMERNEWMNTWSTIELRIPWNRHCAIEPLEKIMKGGPPPCQIACMSSSSLSHRICLLLLPVKGLG